MKTIYEAKQLINHNKGKYVQIKVYGIRNKKEIIKGIISNCYPNIFTLDTNQGKKSFTYTDLLIGNIIVKLN